MAQYIEFGGTGGVPVLDFGLPGGALSAAWPGAGARSTMEIIEGPLESPVAEHAMPDQGFVAVQRGGLHGRAMTARGVIQTRDHETLNGILDTIRSREFIASLMKPTRLQNHNTGLDFSEVILREFRATGPRDVAADGAVVLEYEFQFQIVRE